MLFVCAGTKHDKLVSWFLYPSKAHLDWCESVVWIANGLIIFFIYICSLTLLVVRRESVFVLGDKPCLF